ncbi:uncharacterized protein BDZ99DRAFT_548471 [Mytilinidion resinicola]|uniref:Uncharacterized protein n=1 Tax=Mytilinidion resinicola TaxID=574789 RepID=A0A6A6Z2R0_9PEZI|nr:uncharacterized protein BDZ99DRAFT_548471 [Mytilinidion resinicola]KAF2814517.1 hypothetical protein BDZ99DRAFT_548471 [Mytilinidion resinicola]
MSSCMNILKIIFGRNGDATLPPGLIAALWSLPDGATTCDLSLDNQHSLKDALNQHLSSLPDRILHDIVHACACFTRGSIPESLFDTQSTVVYVTAGALAITVFGYFGAKYINRRMEDVRREARKEYERKLDSAETQARFNQSLVDVAREFQRVMKAQT